MKAHVALHLYIVSFPSHQGAWCMLMILTDEVLYTGQHNRTQLTHTECVHLPWLLCEYNGNKLINLTVSWSGFVQFREIWNIHGSVNRNTNCLTNVCKLCFYHILPFHLLDQHDSNLGLALQTFCSAKPIQ